ncbi:MAG: hypothetical protein WDN48_06380 [Pseudolabrys sp.]
MPCTTTQNTIGATINRDQLEEGVAENLQADGEIGHRDAENDAKHQRGQNLHEQRLIKRVLSARAERGG